MGNGRPAALLIAALLAAGGAQARGKPGAADLSGIWTNVSATPLERPAGLPGPTATPAQAAAFAKAYAAENAADDATGDPVGGGSSEWWERGAQMLRIDGQFRTSVIVEPASGKLPWSPEGLQRAAASRRYTFDGPEQRPSPERCLTGASGSSSVPMLPHRSVSVYKFVQTSDHLAIWVESSGARIVRMTGGPHLPPMMRPYGGDSLGHWDGRTLVVETTNFNPGEAAKIPTTLYIAPSAKVTERFTRLSRDEILYGFTVDDPATYTQPWRGEMILTAIKGPIFEYACHEGNYALPGILAGARREEHAAGTSPGGK